MLVARHGGRPRATASGPMRDVPDERPPPHLFEALHEDMSRVHVLSLDRAEDGAWTIGRDAVSSVALTDDPEVSRRHAVVHWHRGQFEVVDLATSRNGTWVNGERLAKGRPRVLRSGDRIQLGATELEFRA